jgi:hypothetical protein
MHSADTDPVRANIIALTISAVAAAIGATLPVAFLSGCEMEALLQDAAFLGTAWLAGLVVGLVSGYVTWHIDREELKIFCALGAFMGGMVGAAGLLVMEGYLLFYNMPRC